MVGHEKTSTMVPTAVREDPLTQYLLGFGLVTLLIGSVGAAAQILHTSELPSLAYTATILGLAALFGSVAVLYNRTLYTPSAAGEEGPGDSTERSEEPASESLEQPADEGTERVDEESQTSDSPSASSE